MNVVNKICLSVSLCCVFLGVTFGLWIIWFDHPPDVAWRGFVSLALIFGGSCAVSMATAAYQAGWGFKKDKS